MEFVYYILPLHTTYTVIKVAEFALIYSNYITSFLMSVTKLTVTQKWENLIWKTQIFITPNFSKKIYFKNTFIVCVWHWRATTLAENLFVGDRSMQSPSQHAAGEKHQTSLLLSTSKSALSSGRNSCLQFGPATSRLTCHHCITKHDNIIIRCIILFIIWLCFTLR